MLGVYQLTLIFLRVWEQYPATSPTGVTKSILILAWMSSCYITFFLFNYCFFSYCFFLSSSSSAFFDSFFFFYYDCFFFYSCSRWTSCCYTTLLIADLSVLIGDFFDFDVYFWGGFGGCSLDWGDKTISSS